jgi:septal ring factor EnvC (AmiA/AmiB activator)
MNILVMMILQLLQYWEVDMSDVMLLGILRMPFDDHGDLHLIQLRGACNEAADRIESDERIIINHEKTIEKLEEKISDLEEQLYDMQKTYEDKIESLTEQFEIRIEELEIALDEGD